MHCNTLQHTATHCITLHRTATHCNILQHTTTHCNTLQYNITHYNILQHAAIHCNTLQHSATHCIKLMMQCTATATHCNTLPQTATRSICIRVFLVSSSLEMIAFTRNVALREMIQWLKSKPPQIQKEFFGSKLVQVAVFETRLQCVGWVSFAPLRLSDVWM